MGQNHLGGLAAGSDGAAGGNDGFAGGDFKSTCDGGGLAGVLLSSGTMAMDRIRLREPGMAQPGTRAQARAAKMPQ